MVQNPLNLGPKYKIPLNTYFPFTCILIVGFIGCLVPALYLIISETFGKRFKPTEPAKVVIAVRAQVFEC